MPQYLETLLGKAFETIPGELYNQYRWDVAEQSGDAFLFFEVSLLQEKPWKTLRDEVFPLFARYLNAKFLDPHSAHGVVVAIFHNDTCYLLKGTDFVQVFQEVEGLDAAAFAAKVKHWLSI